MRKVSLARYTPSGDSGRFTTTTIDVDRMAALILSGTSPNGGHVK
jgi:hypothetical protein